MAKMKHAKKVQKKVENRPAAPAKPVSAINAEIARLESEIKKFTRPERVLWNW